MTLAAHYGSILGSRITLPHPTKTEEWVRLAICDYYKYQSVISDTEAGDVLHAVHYPNDPIAGHRDYAYAPGDHRQQAAKWRTWQIAVLKELEGGGYKVTLRAAWSLKSKLRCPSYLAYAGPPGACPSGSAAGSVSLVKAIAPNITDWLTLPSFSPDYDEYFALVAAGRNASCPRLLAPTPSCDLHPQLLKGDDAATGWHVWRVDAVNSPPPVPIHPGAPTLKSHDIQDWYVDVTWEDGAAGSPNEKYTVACVRESETCDARPVVTSRAAYRGEGSARVGLPSVPVDLMCYVKARNTAGLACSEGFPVTSKALEGDDLPDVKFLAFETFLRIDWKGGAAFEPEEVYRAWCVGEGQNFGDPRLTRVVSALRSDGTITVPGLQRATNYTCLLTMSNGAVWYPFAASITTLARPPKRPQPPTDVKATITLSGTDLQLFVSWKDGKQARPVESFKVNCVNPGQSCDTEGIYTYRPIDRGKQNTELDFHYHTDSAHDCYVVAMNSLSLPVCSQPVRVPALMERKPSAPTNVGGVVSSMGWGAKWTDAAVFGYKEIGYGYEHYETYTAFCLSHNATCTADCNCTAPSVGRNMTVTRDLQTANVLDLQKSTEYNCYVMAWNFMGNVCSSGHSIKTLDYSRLPGQPVITSTSSRSVYWNDSDPAALPVNETYFVYFHKNGEVWDCSRPWYPWNRAVSRGVGSKDIRTPNEYGPDVYVIARSPGHPDVCSKPMFAPPEPYDGDLTPPEHFPEVWTYAAAPVPKAGSNVTMYVYFRSPPGCGDCHATGIDCYLGEDYDYHDDRLKWEGRCSGYINGACMITGLPLKAKISCEFWDVHLFYHGYSGPVLNVTLDF